MSKPPKHQQLSDEQLAQFSDCVAFWADQLGMTDWRIQVSEVRSKRRGVMAEVSEVDLEQRMATIRAGLSWGLGPVTQGKISQTALHEVLHVFLHELIRFAQDDNVQEDIDSAEHRVINVLERVLSHAVGDIR